MRGQVLIAALLFSGASHAGNSFCKQVKWKPGLEVPVEASIERGVRIELPDNLIVSEDGKTASIELVSKQWFYNIMSGERSIMILPTNEHNKISGFVIWTEDGTMFDFTARLVAADAHPGCVTIVRQGTQTLPTRKARAEAVSLQVAAQVEKEREDTWRLARETRSDERRFVKGGYTWKPVKGCVANVHSNRRFTYVVVRPGCNSSVLTGEVAGQPTVLSTRFEEWNTESAEGGVGDIRIAGHHNTLTLRSNDTVVEINRVGSK